MGDVHQERWMSALPWVLLARRTAYHSELQAAPAEVVLGDMPRLPGDLQPDNNDDHSLADLIDRVKANARRNPAQTSLRRQIPVYFPKKAEEATHVYLKRGKTTPLSPIADGPLLILEKLGKSCLKVKTGEFKSGQPRTEVVHWKNCQPLTLPLDTKTANKPTLGRPKKQPKP